jgi:hypothetical protein
MATAPTRSRPRLRRSRAALALALALLGIQLLPFPAQGSQEVTAGLVVHYPMEQTTGDTVLDTSGHDRQATVHGDAAWRGVEGLQLGGDSGYVDLPDNLLRGLEDVTVSVQVRLSPSQRAPYFLWGLGNTTAGAGDGYLFTTGDAYRTSIATGNWSTEQTVSAGRPVARGVWKTLTYTLADGSATLYEDGVQVARRDGITIRPSDIGGGTTTANYLGRSLYRSDNHLEGHVRDFRVYDRALTPDEVGQVAFISDGERVARDAADLDLGDTSAVTGDIELPATGPYGSQVTWTSSNERVVAPDGEVTRPNPGRGDTTVVLTATVTRGTATVQRQFDVTVLAAPTDAEKVAAAAEALVVWDADDVRGNITLPTTGLYGTQVTWKSSDQRVVTTSGEVSRPSHGSEPESVRLTATVSLENERTLRTFDLTVRPLPRHEPYAGYVFSYFTGEGYADGEQVYFAASRGNDALHWDELNGGEPVLTSSMGDEGVRDPFIIRSPEGDKFYLIATDLKIHGNGNWDYVQRHGSKYIEVWESTDLVHWSEQRHVRISPDTAGNTWAPEAYYDESIGAYVVFWASKLYAKDDPQHTGSTYNRMMYATTRDFRTFSEPKVWVDPGYSVIDSTVIREGDTYYRFTKDERNNTSSTPCSKFILAERSTELRALQWEFVADCIGKGDADSPGIARGEGPTVFKSNTEDKWYLFIDEFGGRGYVPFETTDLGSGSWTMSTDYDLPARPRHGTVLPVTRAELDRVRAALS